MKVAGIIAEYNPIHNGHIYHLQKTKEISMADFVVVVMSGNFTQRGAPALLDKWTRASMAIDAGVDLVLELPFVYACNSAEYFAVGAMEILKRIGIVDVVSFGSEEGNVEKLQEVAEFLKKETPEFQKALKRGLKEGYSFPKARQIGLSQCLGKSAGEIVNRPNNILAVEYLKAKGTLEVITVKRKGSYRSEVTENLQVGEFPSATAIRQSIEAGSMDDILGFMPMTAQKMLKAKGRELAKIEMLYPLVQSSILKSTAEDIADIFSVREGLENKIINQFRRCISWKELVNSLKSKRYTETGLNRLLVHILLNLKKFDLFDRVPYTRVLAMSQSGKALIKRAKSIEGISIIDKGIGRDKSIWPNLLRYDVLASDIYNLAIGRNMYTYSDYVAVPYVGEKNL